MAEQGCPFGPPSIALATSRPHHTFGDPRVTPTGFELAELSTKSEEQPNRRQGIHTHTTSSSSSQASSTHLFAMGLATYTATWAAIGFGIRCYQLGVMQRPLFTNLWAHGISTGLFGSLGYYFYHLKIRQRELLEERRAESKIFQETQKIKNALRKQQQEQLESTLSH
ncbi:hypothetical protein PSTG_06703 [Puccinia striiformis f. sp. tritici PST-78]|uniref:Cytochrome c oxidase assembly protein COX20, mitochondrial n=2 Tax=Puccinia striiformis f. sp. tritici TaxID=168172 RepID=A0A0L0VLJ6_9BASI|nr:hypothetical protein PSTG_06703 [Puccinia striiformis f. sp. tritici PST-78]